MNSPFEMIADRLEGVRRTGRDRLIALCPAHGDRRPSLSAREADDGRVLLHCWAGCEAHQVVEALGLRMSDLFPRDERDAHGRRTGSKPERRPWSAGDLLALAAWEASVAAVASIDVAHAAGLLGELPPQLRESVDRLIESSARLTNMQEVVHGHQR